MIVIGAIAACLILLSYSSVLTERACEAYNDRHNGTTKMVNGHCYHDDGKGNITVLPLWGIEMIDVALPEAPRNSEAHNLARWLRGQEDKKYKRVKLHKDVWYNKGYDTQEILEDVYTQNDRDWETSS